MIISPPIYPQTAAAAISDYGGAASLPSYGASPSYSASAPVAMGSFSDAPGALAALASQIAQSVYDAVMDRLGPMLGLEKSEGSYLANSNFVQYATTTKKPKTFLDKLIAWFGSIGDLGNNISKGMKAGREVFDGISSAFTWLSENNLGDTITKIGTGITDSLSSIGDSISGAARAVWDWLF